MAKEQSSKPAGSSAAPADKSGSGPAAGGGLKQRLKVALIVAAVLVLEVATVTLTITLSGGPRAASGRTSEAEAQAQENRPVELLLIKQQFVNERSGHQYLYDTEIYIAVRQKHHDQMKAQVEAKKAQITADLAALFRRADPEILKEDELTTVRRQIRSVLDDRMGRDADGKPLVQDLFITRCVGVRTDL